jgi:hypothetical protein
VTNPSRREPSDPHGWLGYVVADCRRTANAVRIARWAVVAITVIAAAIVVVALNSPRTAAALVAENSPTRNATMTPASLIIDHARQLLVRAELSISQ